MYGSVGMGQDVDFLCLLAGFHAAVAFDTLGGIPDKTGIGIIKRKRLNGVLQIGF
jgi:hypothetical protein